VPWAKVSCKCESSDPACCEEWDCGSVDGICVPCKPCDGLIPDGDTPDGGGCDDPPGKGCSAEDLQRQLDANKKCISARQTEKAHIEADIKARLDREKELTALISTFDSIVEKYKTERHKLSCREDCLNGFHRDVAATLKTKFSAECLKAMEAAINAELCAIEKAKCCQKNLEGKLTRETRLVRQQQEAEKAWKAAEDAFAQIRDLPKWMGDRFTELEKLKDQIAQALNDKDPLKHRHAFYLFYWKFVPGLCKRFKVAICCTTGEAAKAGAAGVHIGCSPGDWHPSRISPEDLTKLICCAWEYVKGQKEKYQNAVAAVDTAKQHLDFIKKRVEDDGKTLEDRVRRRIEQVVCAPPASSR
jgi:uncharacterized protein YaiL (DUF2058 family)